MQVFKLYFKVLKSAAPFLMIYGIIFIALTIIFSKGQEQNITAYQQSKIETAIVNYDEDNILVQDMLDYLSNFCNFHFYGYGQNDLADALFFREVNYILTIPHDFGDDFLSAREVSVKRQSVPGSIDTTTVDYAINKYLNTVKIYRDAMPDISEKDIISFVRKDISMETKVTMENMDGERNNYIFYNNYFNTSAYVMLAGCILGIGTIMLSFQNIHIHRRNIVAPISIKNMDFQLICGNFIFVLLFDLILILFGQLFSKEGTMDGNVVLFCLNTIIFSISSLALSYLVALLVRSKGAANTVSIVISLGLSFIGGAFIPQYLLGATVLRIASFTPVYWFVKGNNIIAGLTEININSLRTVLICMFIQLGFAAALFALSFVVRKNRSQVDN